MLGDKKMIKLNNKREGNKSMNNELNNNNNNKTEGSNTMSNELNNNNNKTFSIVFPLYLVNKHYSAC